MPYSSTGSIALAAKLKAMYGKRLSQQNYKELLRKQNVSEIAAYIKQQTFYADILRDVNENSVHRGQLELVLRRALYGEYEKMLHYVSESEANFYTFFIKRLEIDEIINCVRHLSADKQSEYFFSLPAYFAKRASFDLYSLAKVKSYDELLKLLADTPYGEILRKFDPNAEIQSDIIRIENEFNRYYYGFILRLIDQNFSGAVRTQIRDSFGVEIDLANITDIIRLKKYFNAKADEIRSLLLPYYFRISRSQLNRMIEAPDTESAMQVLNETSYGRFFQNNSFDFLELYSLQIVYRHNQRQLNLSNSTPVLVVSYLQLKRIETRNLITIIESVRYNLNPSEISPLLIGVS